jgi:hypothetical protein
MGRFVRYYHITITSNYEPLTVFQFSIREGIFIFTTTFLSAMRRTYSHTLVSGSSFIYLTTDLDVVLSLRMHGSVPPYPYTPLWCDDEAQIYF